jgi:peroxiredoxin Q/BCP
MSINVGDPAPAFDTVDETGKQVRLVDFAGHHPIALVFIPKDDTPG